MSKNLSGKYYQENKERLQKKVRERYQNLSKEENEKSDNMIEKVTKISQKMKKKLVEHRKKYYRMSKTLYYNYKNFCFIKRKSIKIF